MSTEQFKQNTNSYQIVFKGKNGVASFPVKHYFCAPIAQEKLYKEFWNVQ